MHPVATLLLTTPAVSEAPKIASRMTAILFILALTGLVALSVLALFAIRRRTRFRAEAAARRAAGPVPKDAWVESSRRLPLEEHESIPREPGTE